MTLRDWLVQLELAGGWELFLRDDEPALVRYDEGVYERIQLEDTGLAVDPDRVLLLDANLTNNGRTLAPRGPAAATKWSLRWMVWLQDLLITYGLFV